MGNIRGAMRVPVIHDVARVWLTILAAMDGKTVSLAMEGNSDGLFYSAL